MIFQRCHRLRKTTSANADIIVRFSWYGDRESVWNNRSMLKGSDIYINEDFPEEMEKRRTRLYPIVKAARSKKMKATLNKDKLIVGGKTYQLETLDSLPEEIQPKTLATRETEHLVLFYGQDSCYSSFYPSQFMIDGTNFVCSEQYYQYNKALRLGNNDIAEQIMKTDKAAEHHRLGKKLRVDGTIWSKAIAQQVMDAGTTAKFEQNLDLRRILMATGNKKFAECNMFDKTWGNGISLNHTIQTKWSGENLLRTILASVRDSFK